MLSPEADESFGTQPLDEEQNRSHASHVKRISVRSDLMMASPRQNTTAEEVQVANADESFETQPLGEEQNHIRDSHVKRITVRSDLMMARPTQNRTAEEDQVANVSPFDLPGCSSDLGCSTSSMGKIRVRSNLMPLPKSQEEDETYDVASSGLLTENFGPRRVGHKYITPPELMPVVFSDVDLNTLRNVETGSSAGTRKRKLLNPPFIEVDRSVACQMTFHRTSNELVVAFAGCIKYFRMLEQPMDEVELQLTKTLPLSLPSNITLIAYGCEGSEVVAIAGTRLISIGDGFDLKTHVEFSEQALAMDVGEYHAVVGSKQGVVCAIELESNRTEFILKVGEDEVRNVTFQNTSKLCGIAKHLIFVIDVCKEVVENEVPTLCELLCAAMHGIFFVVGTSDGKLIVYDTHILSIWDTYQITYGIPITSLSTIGDTHIAVGCIDGSLKIFSIFPIEEVTSFGKLAGPILSLSVSPDNRWLLANDKETCKLFPLGDLHIKRKQLREQVPIPVPSVPMPGIPMPIMSDMGVYIKQEPEEELCEVVSIKTEPEDDYHF